MTVDPPGLPQDFSVLHIFDHSLPHQTGYAFRSAAILAEQRALGWQTWQLTSAKQESELLEERVAGWHFYRTPASPGRLAKLPVVEQLDTIRTLAGRLDQLLDRLRPRVLHAYSPCLTALAALRIARRRGLPLVYEMRSSWEDAAVTRGTARHGDLRYRASRALESWVLHRVDAITTICAGLQRDIIDRGVAPARVSVVPNAVDREMLQPASPEQAARLRAQLAAPGELLVGYIGSLHPYEGLELLLDAVRQLGQAAEHFRFLLAGGGSAEPGLRARAQALGLAERVRFLGRVPHADIRDYYAAMDILLYPRRRSELTDKVTPLKPLEAMAQKRLVLASDIGGHRELVRHGETGLLFRPDDPVALAEALLDAARRPDRDAICERAHAWVHAERSWAHCARRYAAVYAGVLAQSGAGKGP